MIFTNAYALYIDVDRPGGLNPLLDGKASSRLSETPSFVLADKFRLQLWFRRCAAAGEASDVVEVASGNAIVVAAKLTSDLDADDLLFYADGFAKQGSGDDIYYETTLDLNTDELIEAIGDNDSAELTVDVEVQNAGNTERVTFQIDAVVVRHAYAGESEPTPATPTYPAPGNIVVKYRGSAAISAGAESVVVSGMGLSFTPAQVLVTVRKPQNGSNLAATVIDSSISTDGFVADLSAPAPEAGYKCDYLVIE